MVRDTPIKVAAADTNTTGNAGVGPVNRVEGKTRFFLPDNSKPVKS